MNIPIQLLPIRIGRTQLAEFARASYFILARPGVTPDHIVDPDFWVNWASTLKINDRIEVVAADGSFDMEVRVVALDPRGLWARVRPLRIAEGKIPVSSSPTGQYPDAEGYIVEFSDHHRWRIIRGNDIVARDFPDQASAIEALQQIKQTKRPVAMPLVPRMSDPRPEEPEPEAPPVEEPPGEGEPPAEPDEAAKRARTGTGQFAAKPKAA
jgi:hypothetical protein